MVEGEMVLQRGLWTRTLYKLLGSVVTSGCNSTTIFKNDIDRTSSFPIAKKTMPWHQRLGHIGEKGLHALHSKGMVEGFLECSLGFDFCEHWVFGKKNKVSGAIKAKGILD